MTFSPADAGRIGAVASQVTGGVERPPPRTGVAKVFAKASTTLGISSLRRAHGHRSRRDPGRLTGELTGDCADAIPAKPGHRGGHANREHDRR